MPKKEKKESFLLNLVLNIFVPVIILTRFSGEELLGPTMGIIVALAFPVGYGIYDFIDRRKFNVLSAIGFVSVLLTGGISLLQLDPELIAIKEAGVPLVIGIAVLLSLKTPWPIVKKLMMQVINEKAVYRALKKKRKVADFENRMTKTTYLFAVSFFISSVLNYVLAKAIVVSQPGTVAFNEELGTMTALSFPVIALPMFVIVMFIIWYMISGVRNITGMKLENIFKSPE